MDLTFKKLINNCITQCAHDQAAVTCAVSTKERSGVKKLLSVTAECKVYTVEAMKGEAKITGKACYKVIYLDRDNKTCGLDYFCDFNQVITGEINPTDRLFVNQSVVDVAGKIDDDNITLTAVCDFVLMVVSTFEAKTVDSADGMFTNREIMQCVTLSALTEDTFEISHEYESGDSVDKVLYFAVTPIITATSRTESGVKVDGLVQAEIVYSCSKGVSGKSFSIPFSEDVQAENLADIYINTKSSRLVLSGDQSNNVFEIQAFLTLSGFDVGVKDEEVVTDVFSTTKQLDANIETQSCRHFAGAHAFDFALSGDVESEGLLSASEVLATPVTRVNIANVIAGQGEVTVEGLAVATVLYMNEDRVDSVQVELPFSVSERIEKVTPSDIMKGQAVITDFSAKFSNGKINLKANLKVRVSVYQTNTLKWVSEIVEGEDKPVNNNGITIYYVGANDSTWDIAKAVNISPDEVNQLTPNADNPTQETKRVVVFRKR